MPERQPLVPNDPANAWSKAETIGNDPTGPSNWQYGAMPMGPPSAGGKSLADLLGEIFTPNAKGTGLPARLRLTSYDPAAGSVNFTGADKGEPIQSTIRELHQLLTGGALQQEGQASGQTVPQLARRLLKLVGK